MRLYALLRTEIYDPKMNHQQGPARQWETLLWTLESNMILNHIHLRVRDLNAAVIWFEKVMQLHPGFRNERMATFLFGPMTLIFDAAQDDVAATVGFESMDCDADFQTVVGRGAVSLEGPSNKDWGVRTAYFKGPGELRFEIEGPIKESLEV